MYTNIAYRFVPVVRLTVDFRRFFNQLEHERGRVFGFGVVLEEGHCVADGMGGKRQREKNPIANNGTGLTVPTSSPQHRPVHGGRGHFTVEYQVRPVLERDRVQRVRDGLREREYRRVHVHLFPRLSKTPSTLSNVRFTRRTGVRRPSTLTGSEFSDFRDKDRRISALYPAIVPYARSARLPSLSKITFPAKRRVYIISGRSKMTGGGGASFPHFPVYGVSRTAVYLTPETSAYFRISLKLLLPSFARAAQ